MTKVPVPSDKPYLGGGDPPLISDGESVGDTSIVGYTPVNKRKSWIGKLGNFSVQYNLAVASIGVKVMSDYDGVKNHPEPSFSHYTLMGMVFVGSVCGMLGMGYLGDWIGRKRAMLFTLFLVIFGALASGLATWGSSNSIYGVLCAARFIVGVGVGGIYPLSAARASEGQKRNEAEEDLRTKEQLHKDTTNSVAWAFFWQTPGAIAPYVLVMLFLGIRELLHNANDFSIDLQWRILYIFGALPTFAALCLNTLIPESKEFEEARKAQKEFSAVKFVKAHPARKELLHALFGTAASWFMYDVSYYGTAIFTPPILKEIFGDDEKIFATSWQSTVVGALGIPAAVVAIWNAERFGSYNVQLWGFVLMAVSFALLGIAFVVNAASWVKFVLFLLVSFAINYGPNVTTFTLPAVLFPTEVKGTFHGISAAAAKVGAVAGTFMYQPVCDATSLQFMMFMQAVLSCVGVVVTYIFIPREEQPVGPSRVVDDDVEKRVDESARLTADAPSGSDGEYGAAGARAS